MQQQPSHFLGGLDFRPAMPGTDSPNTAFDWPAVERAVRAYCAEIGADDSCTLGAIAWASKVGVNTLHGIREGKRRAEALKARASK
jgi:hypothetical protein